MAEYDLTPSERQIADTLRSLKEDPVTWSEPPPEVWSRIEQALPDPGQEPDVADDQHSPQPHTNVRPLHQRPEQRRDEHRRPRTVPRRNLLAVAAGGLLAGVGLGAIGWQQLDSRRVDVLATAELTPLDAPDRLGTAQVRRTPAGLELRLAAATPFQVPTGYIEVWLINLDGRRMVSVGIYGGRADETFPITPDLLREGYVVVDLSREVFDDDPTHSGDSLVRGQLNL